MFSVKEPEKGRHEGRVGAGGESPGGLDYKKGGSSIYRSRVGSEEVASLVMNKVVEDNVLL